MKLVLLRPARKSLEDMPRSDAMAILTKLRAVAADPFGDHPQARRLTNAGGFRLRHGDWRATYAIDRTSGTVVVENIKHRREAYR